MVFDIRNSVPREALDEAGNFSMERFMEHSRTCKALAEQIAGAPEVSSTRHRILLLVDLQGVYLALVDWLKERSFPLESGLLISRFAIFLLNSVVDAVKADVMAKAGEGAVLFDDLEPAS